MPFYHLGHTGISTTRVPDLDTSLAINGFKTLAACHTGQAGRQNARPAASMIAGASLRPPLLLLRFASLSLSAEHNMEKVTLLRLLQLKVRLDTRSPFKDLNHTLLVWKVAIEVVLRLLRRRA